MKQFLLAAMICLATIKAFSQGSLTPTGAPTNTMKTLAQIEPRTPISSLPYNITNAGSYYLTTNLSLATGDYGIQISTNHVTLDLGGFALVNASNAASAILFPGTCTNVAVRHGIISSWINLGVSAGESSGNEKSGNLVFEDLQISGSSSGVGISVTATSATIRNCLCYSNFGGGIYITGGIVTGCQVSGSSYGSGITAYNATVSDCTVNDNAGNGMEITSGRIKNCVVERNSGYSIAADRSTVEHCTVQYGQEYGVYAINSEVSHCFILGNSLSGIYVDSPGCLIVGNTCNQNNTLNSFSEAGIYINDSSSRLEDNHVALNGTNGYGIYLNNSYSNNIVVKNDVMNTPTNRNYFLGVKNDVGPISTATNFSPWVNFSH